GPRTLALIDEVGGATDPEEGSAIARAYLEALVESGGRALVTTHLSAGKTFASSRSDSLTAAMEVDEKTGRPTYPLHAGLAGRSHALSVARERGLPEPVLERATALLGEQWKRRERAETEAEQALERLRDAERELERERESARLERERLDAERKKAAEERARMRAEGLAAVERPEAELGTRCERAPGRARG